MHQQKDMHTGHQHHSNVWTCSMHPQIRQPEAGQCPLCGMDLILATSDEDDQDPDIPSDHIVLSQRARALAKLQTTTVQAQSTNTFDIRLLGRIEPNESNLKTVTAWTSGRIDKLHVNTTGQRVRRGQIIATLYSPEVFAAHQDLLVAKQQLNRTSASTAPSTQIATKAAVEAARERIRLLGVPDDELARMEKRQKPTRAIPIRSPFRGTILERFATEGSYIQTGTKLYTIANLTSLWIQLDAYENDLQRLDLGQLVQVEVEAYPGEIFKGTVTFIDPTLDPNRRTARVRVEVSNKDQRLRPGMFAQAVVSTQPGNNIAAQLVIPATAPLFTGRRAVVYVEHQNQDKISYEPRVVRLGPRLADVYPVVSGLSQGEHIVTRGAFTIDADLQIRGGPSMMTQPDDSEQLTQSISPSQLRELTPILQAYLKMQRTLAADNLHGSHQAASNLETALSKRKSIDTNQLSSVWIPIKDKLRQHNHHVRMSSSLQQARMGFEGLSQNISLLLQKFGNPLDIPISKAYCPMAMGSDGASWFQQSDVIDNAYFGESMRTCGEIQKQIAPGDRLKLQHGRH